jgi:hypothetical protein
MPRSVSCCAAIGAVMLLVAACGSSSTAVTPSVAPPTAAPSAAASAAVAHSAVPATTGQTFDTSPLGRHFDLPMTIALPAGWIALPPPADAPDRTLTIVHGVRGGDPATWWGPDLDLVDGARVIDPADVTTKGDGTW